MAKRKSERPRTGGERVVEDKPRGRSRRGASGKPVPREGESVQRNPVTGEPIEQGNPNMKPNQSTPSQQPTGLETRGGTEQPHPTVAARAGRSSTQLPPPGRSHDDTLRRFMPTGPGGTLRVRATQAGYYQHIRRRVGDVFDLVPREGLVTETIRTNPKDPESDPVLDPRTDLPKTRQVKKALSAEDQFSENWMEKVDAKEQEKITTSKQALQQAHDEIAGGKTTRVSDKDVTGDEAQV